MSVYPFTRLHSARREIYLLTRLFHYLLFHRALMIDKEKIKCKDSTDIRGIIEDLDTLGLYNPWNTVFCDLSHSPYFALFWIVFIIATIPKIYLFVNGNTNAMLKRIGNRSSGLLMVYGFATIFRQYNPALMKTFVDYYSVYIKSCVENLAR